jgi:site-specific recombinase XerD
MAFLSEKVRAVLGEFLASKRVIEQPLTRKAPLFVACGWRRLSLRQLQVIFKKWQERAGFDRPYNFHTLRHTAITNVYRATKDLFLTQRFARHANPITTVAYTHPSDEEIYSAIAGI